MSSIISWFNNEREGFSSIWTCSDSKVSVNENEALSLNGSKIFKLRIKVHKGHVWFSNVIHESDLIYSYAGNSFVGFETFSYLSNAFENLLCVNSANQLPSFDELIDFAKGVLEYYVRSTRKPSEIIINGICPKTKELFIAKIFLVQTANSISFDKEVIKNSSENKKLRILLCGDKQKEISQQVIENFESKKFEYIWRIPFNTLKEIIEKSMYGTIGGGLQLGYTNIFYTTISSVTVEIRNLDGSKEHTMKFKNIDIYEDINNIIGETCIVSIPGMAML